MRRVRVRIAILLVVVLIGAVVAGIGLSQPERLLLQRATKVPLAGGAMRQYWWLPDGRMLLTRDAPRRRTHPGEMIHHGDIIVTIYLYDLTTRTEKPLRRLSRLFNKSEWFGERTVSPDGKWWMWSPDEGSFSVSMLDGSHHFQWVVHNGWDPVLWLPDSSGVVSVYLDPAGDEADICSVRPPHTPRSFPFHPEKMLELSNIDDYFLVSKDRMLVMKSGYPQNAIRRFLERSPGGFMEVLSRIDRMYLNGHLHLAYPDPNDKPISRVQVYETTLQRKPPRSRKFTIHLPRRARVREAVFSPTGDRIAWLLTFYCGAKIVHGLWVCRLDGSGMREIGHVTTTNRDADCVFNPAWLPDGKRLNFCTKDGLYTVPIAGE